MKVTVLGGSAAGGNTGAGCSGYLVQTAGANFAIDCGPGVLLELRKHVNYRRLDGIVISHLHLDHTLDLGALRYALAYNPVKPDRRIPLWMPPGGKSFLDAFGATFSESLDELDFFTSIFDVAEYDPSGMITIGDASITFVKTVHYIPCWAIRVHAGTDGDFFYTADTGPAADLTAFGSGCRVIAAESGTLNGAGESFEARGHLTPNEAGALATAVGAKTLILTHLWEEYGFDRYRELAASTFDGDLEIAHPGLTIEW